MKNFLLINPWVYDFKCHDFWLRPYGLLRIASALKKSGHNVSLIDCMDRFDPEAPEKYKKTAPSGRGDFYREEITDKPAPFKKVPRKYKRYGLAMDNFEKRLKKIPAPDFVFVTTGPTFLYQGPQQAITLVKEKFPGAKVIAGGIYATLCPGHARATLGADLVWEGRVDEGFSRAAGIAMDFSPGEAPDYSFYADLPIAAVKLTDGCPFKCTYCASKILTPGFYRRGPDEFFAELERYRARGVKNIAFYDDALLFDRELIKKVMAGIIEKNYGFNFQVPNGLHAAYLDEEIAGLMFRAGFKSPNISLETTDREIQGATGGKVTNEGFARAVQNLAMAGYPAEEIGVYMIAGLPGQGYGSVMRDVEFVKKTGAKIRLSSWTPIPGTADFEKLAPELKAELNEEPLKQNDYYYLIINKEYGWKEHEEAKKIISGW